MDTKRFNNPEYKRQISAVRNYRRQAQAVPETKLKRAIQKTGAARLRNQILLVIAIALFVYLTYFAKFLMIKDISVAGADQRASDAIKQNFQDFLHQRRAGVFPERNILYFSGTKYSAYLLANNYQVAAVDSLNAYLWNKVSIKINQRVPKYILQSGDNFYILNSDGAVGAQLQPDQLGPNPLLKDSAAEAVTSGEQFLDAKQNNFIQSITDDLKAKLSLETSSYEVPGRASAELIVYLKGSKIIFSTNSDPENVFQKFSTLWMNLNSDQQAKISYIDMRFDQNAYSCNHGDACDH